MLTLKGGLMTEDTYREYLNPPKGRAETPIKYKLYDNSDEAFAYLKAAIDYSKPIFFDTETRSLYKDLALAQFYQEHWDEVILIRKPNAYAIAAVLDDAHIVGHNIAYDVSMLQTEMGRTAWLPKDLDCTLLLSRLEFYKSQEFGLDYCLHLAKSEHNYGTPKHLMQKSDWFVPVLSEQQLHYACSDVYALPHLWHSVKSHCDTPSYKLDKASLKSCLVFQCNGFPVLHDQVGELYTENVKKVAEVGLPINPNSYQQVRPYVGIDMLQPSDDKALAWLAAKGNDRAKNVRYVKKLLRQNSFLKKSDNTDGVIYGYFKPLARSGRTTCSRDNLQQLPRATKRCFGVTEDSGQVLVYSDFSQLELRSICAITADRKMLELYRKGIDIHQYVAIQLFKTETPTTEQRRIAKTCNFILLYGAGYKILAEFLLKTAGIVMSESEARATRAKWRNLWPQLKLWQEGGISAWRNHIAWSTPLGRKYVAGLLTDQLNIQVQGMGSEVSRLAMVYLERKLAQQKDDRWADWSTWLRNFIHDSYIFTVPDDEEVYKPFCIFLADAMQGAWRDISAACKVKDLPMPVEVGVGYSWGKIESDDSPNVYDYVRE